MLFVRVNGWVRWVTRYGLGLRAEPAAELNQITDVTGLLQGYEMVNKEEFARLHADFIESQDFIDLVHTIQRDMDFVCRQNAYLVARFLQRRGYNGLRWVSGYYQCREPERRIHHSWIKLVRDGRLVAIFEFDPQQLHKQGEYDADLMPSGNVPEFSITVSGIASIVDPDLVDVPEEEKELPWVVPSSEVLLRYVEHDDPASLQAICGDPESAILVCIFSSVGKAIQRSPG